MPFNISVTADPSFTSYLVPVTTESMSMISRTEVHSGPGVSHGPTQGTQPSLVYRPGDGLKPTSPVQMAGRRHEPPVSEPMPAETIPAATAAAVPLLLPAGVLAKFTGFRHLPCKGLMQFVLRAISGMFVFATTMAPASSNDWITGEVLFGRQPLRTGFEASVSVPAMSKLSFTTIGSPSKGPKGVPEANFSSTTLALAQGSESGCDPHGK